MEDQFIPGYITYDVIEGIVYSLEWLVMIQVFFEIIIVINIIWREKNETPERLEYLYRNSSYDIA